MAIQTPVKTDSVVVLAHQAAAHPITIKGSAQDVRTKKAVTIFMHHGYIEATDDANPGKFLIQVRPDAGNSTVTEHWQTVAEYEVKGTTPDTEAVNATEPIGETALAVVSTAGFVAGDQLYIQHTTLASSEWAECQEVTGTPEIVLIDGLTTEQTAAASIIFNDASKFVHTMGLNAIESYRVIWSHEGGTGANGHIKVLAITHDSETST